MKVPSRNICERGVEGVGPRHWLPLGLSPHRGSSSLSASPCEQGPAAVVVAAPPSPFPLVVLPRPPLLSSTHDHPVSRGSQQWVVAWGPCRCS